MAAEEASNSDEKVLKISKSHSNDVFKIVDHCKSNQGMKLDLSNKSIKSIPDELLHLNHIQYLYLERNNLQEIPELLSENLTQLKWLDVRHNKLTCLPRNLFLLKNLKNLLLEGNQLIQLPLELGLLTSLSGLNLTNNPLEFPPKDTIESGTKAILKFLRERLAIEQRFGHMELNDVAPNSSAPLDVQTKAKSIVGTSDTANDDNLSPDEAPSYTEYQQCRNPLGARRHSLEEDMFRSPPYSINSLLIKERERAARRRKEFSFSAPVRKVRQTKRNSEAFNAPTNRDRHRGYFRSETIDSTYERATKKAEQKEFNDKADAIIQKRKDKVKLDEWRWKTKQLQARKYRSRRSTKHEVKLPFGSDLEKKDQPVGKHAKDVREALDKDHAERMRVLRDSQLEERIQEHAKHIREWKHKEQVDSMEDELAIAKSNLEKALTLQKELKEKRALQYRLRAFTAEDFAPKSHGGPTGKNQP